VTPLRPLFRDHPRLRAVLDAVLEGRQGAIRVPKGAGDPPAVARLELGCYAAPGGDPTAPAAAGLLQDLTGPLEIVVPDDDRWRLLLARTFGDRVTDRSMKAYVGDRLDGEALAARAAALPAGTRVVGIGRAEAAQLGPGLSPHGVDVFGGPEAFVRDGFGVGAVVGDALVCAATTYALSADKAEVAITTRADHRGRGLAAAVSAAMFVECRRRGVTPHWNAFNPVSQRLAERLGLRPDGVCEILMLDGE